MNKLIKSVIYDKSVLNAKYYVSKCHHVLICYEFGDIIYDDAYCNICKRHNFFSTIIVNFNTYIIKQLKIVYYKQRNYVTSFKNMLCLKLLTLQLYYNKNSFESIFILCYKKIFKNKYIAYCNKYAIASTKIYFKNKIIYVL